MNNELETRLYKTTHEGGGKYSIAIVEDVHRKVELGEVFTVSKTFTSVANLDYARMVIKAGSAKKTHYVFSVAAEGKCYLKTILNSTYTANGTEMTPFNRYVDSSNVFSGKIYHTPTVNVEGTVRGDDMIPGGGTPQAAGASSITVIETILGANDNMLLQIQNVSGQVKDFNVIINFYEE